MTDPQTTPARQRTPQRQPAAASCAMPAVMRAGDPVAALKSLADDSPTVRAARHLQASAQLKPPVQRVVDIGGVLYGKGEERGFKDVLNLFSGPQKAQLKSISK